MCSRVLQQGHVECDLQECPLLDCPDGSFRVKNPGKCCYECTDVISVVYTIDTSTPCVYEGRLYTHNDHWEVDECTSCTCVSGDVHCQTQRCPPLTCASVSYTHACTYCTYCTYWEWHTDHIWLCVWRMKRQLSCLECVVLTAFLGRPRVSCLETLITGLSMARWWTSRARVHTC